MLTHYAPLLLYFISFLVMLVTLFRVNIGLLYFIWLVPMIVVLKKIATYPQGNSVPNFLLLSLLIGWILNNLREGKRIFKSSPMNIAVILIVLGSIINLIRGFTFLNLPDDVNMVRLAAWKNFMILPALYFISINSIEKERVTKWIIICICFTMLAMCFHFYGTFKWIKAEHYSHDLRISGLFRFLGPNEFGIFFSIYTFLLLGISYFIENKKLKYFVLFACACNFYPILYTYSRSGYLCTIAGILVLGLLKDRKLLVLLAVLLLAYRFVLPLSVVERIDMTFLGKEEVSEERVETSVFDLGEVSIEVPGRKILWEKAIAYFNTQPIFGIGFESFLYLEGWITHGMFFTILAEQGSVGMTIFVLFITMILWQSLRLFRHSTTKLGQGIGLGFFTCSVAFLIGSVTGDTFIYYNMMAIYWVFLGVVASFNARDRSEKPSHV